MGHQIEQLPRSSLSRLESVLLWAMRAWVVGIVEKIPVEEQICDAFRQIGVPGGTAQLYEFMWVVSQGATRTIDVDCVCKARVSRDERSLLNVIALAQHERTFEALVLLRSMLEPKIAMAAVDSAARIAAMLRAEGQHLPVPTMDTDRYMFAASIDSRERTPRSSYRFH